MASLARSLLALALLALLQVACAVSPVNDLLSRGEFPGPFRSEHPGPALSAPQCKKYMFGQGSRYFHYKLPPIHITQAISKVRIPDSYRDPITLGKILIGEEITVCNRRGGPPSDVSLSSQDSFEYVTVASRDCVPGPVDVEMSVTRYFKVLEPGPSEESDSDDDYDL